MTLQIIWCFSSNKIAREAGFVTPPHDASKVTARNTFCIVK